MKDTHKIVWSLWPDIQLMARDLNESPAALVEAKYAEDIPNARHDRTIIQRAIFQNVKLNYDDLAKQRDHKVRALAVDDRQQIIQDFLDKAGGVDVVALFTGMSENSLYIAKSRGRLPQKKKYELKMLAQKVPFDLVDDLFKAP